MKTEIIQINNLFITYYVGQNSQENFTIIDNASENDIWASFTTRHISKISINQYKILDKGYTKTIQKTKIYLYLKQ